MMRFGPACLPHGWSFGSRLRLFHGLASYVYVWYLVRKSAGMKVDMAAEVEEEKRDEGGMGNGEWVVKGKREKR